MFFFRLKKLHDLKIVTIFNERLLPSLFSPSPWHLTDQLLKNNRLTKVWVLVCFALLNFVLLNFRQDPDGPSYPQIPYIPKDALEFLIFVPLVPKHLNFSYVSPCPANCFILCLCRLFQRLENIKQTLHHRSLSQSLEAPTVLVLGRSIGMYHNKGLHLTFSKQKLIFSRS